MSLTRSVVGEIPVPQFDQFAAGTLELGRTRSPKAIVQFENGMRLMVDERMKWERVT